MNRNPPSSTPSASLPLAPLPNSISLSWMFHSYWPIRVCHGLREPIDPLLLNFKSAPFCAVSHHFILNRCNPPPPHPSPVFTRGFFTMPIRLLLNPHLQPSPLHHHHTSPSTAQPTCTRYTSSIISSHHHCLECIREYSCLHNLISPLHKMKSQWTLNAKDSIH